MATAIAAYASLVLIVFAFLQAGKSEDFDE